MKKILKILALAAGLAAPGAALAATDAIVVNDLNVRTGPGAQYQRYGTIPGGDHVTVYGCLVGYNWCDVDWRGGRGWVSGNYLAYSGRRYDRQPISTIGVRIGVPVLGFDPYDYHRRHYVGRPWYHDRYLDRPDGPPPRPDRFERPDRFDRPDRFGDDRPRRPDRPDRYDDPDGPDGLGGYRRPRPDDGRPPPPRDEFGGVYDGRRLSRDEAIGPRGGVYDARRRDDADERIDRRRPLDTPDDFDQGDDLLLPRRF